MDNNVLLDSLHGTRGSADKTGSIGQEWFSSHGTYTKFMWCSENHNKLTELKC